MDMWEKNFRMFWIWCPDYAFLDWETAVSCIIAPRLPKIFPVISHLTDGHGLVHSPAGLSGGQDSDTAD